MIPVRVWTALVALAGIAAQAQESQHAADVPSFGVATELVYVRFHAERDRRHLAELLPDQIRVLEDGRPQAIVLLETPATRERTLLPEVTLALDVSSSVMDARLLDRELLEEVFLAGLSAETSVGLCAFGGELHCLVPPTRDVRTLLDGLEQALLLGHRTRGQGTRLYASLADIARDRGSAFAPQRALVVFSDGLDNHGGELKQAMGAALEANLRVYAVKLAQAFRDTAPGRFGIFGRPRSRAFYDYKKLDLDRLAAETGGRAYEPARLDRSSLADILREIAIEIRMECVVGYQPEGAATGRERKVKIELVDRSLGRIRGGERSFVR